MTQLKRTNLHSKEKKSKENFFNKNLLMKVNFRKITPQRIFFFFFLIYSEDWSVPRTTIWETLI